VRFQFRLAGPVFLKAKRLRIFDFLINPASEESTLDLCLDRDASKRLDGLNRASRLRHHP
jgi:hypothetical protein